MKPVIAIIGRPNVGKSTLFNRILGHREAIVQDEPGVTRDRNYATAEHADREFVIVDTGGFDPEAEDGMLALMKRQVELALAEADALVVVFDAREGLTGTDEAIWALVRESGRRAFVVVNKVDRPTHEQLVADFYRLGVDDLLPMAAESGYGVADLLDRIVAALDPPPAGAAEDPAAGPVKIAVIGRPNVGKSTFSNALLGRDRYLTSDVPGTTRDAVDTPFTANGRDYLLIDTAGMRRPNRVEMGLERMSVARTVQAVERCHVAALVIDGAEGPTDQDKKLCGLAIERGRAVVLVVNKWDLVKGDRSGDAYAKKLAEEFAFASYLPHLYTTALSGRNVQKFLPIVNRLHANLFRRIPTHELNTFYREVLQTHPPMPGGSGSVRIRFLTQVQVDPPTILAFAGGRGEVPQNYVRFIQRELRDRYNFEGVPLRIITKRK